jgi:phage-related protein
MDKPIDWRGSSLDDLREFPEAARKQAGHDLRNLQRGEAPDDWRPFPEVGPGTNEIRIDCEDGWFRVLRREVCGSNLRPSQLSKSNPKDQ